MDVSPYNYGSWFLLNKLMYWSLRLKSPLNRGPGKEKHCGNNELHQTFIGFCCFHSKTSFYYFTMY